MQGYIIQVNPVKDEDLIVTIISEDSLETLYRFYGARHSAINLGFKIDFEIESSVRSTISRLRDTKHLGFSWLRSHKHLYLWQFYIKLFMPHLRDAHGINSFYFKLLEYSSYMWDKQNPKRVAIESYVKLLEYEGRLFNTTKCFFCEQEITDQEISVIRAFLPAHSSCCKTSSVNTKAFRKLLHDQRSLMLDDEEVDTLWDVLNEGL